MQSPVPHNLPNQNYRVLWVNQSEGNVAVDLFGFDGVIYHNIHQHKDLSWLAVSFGIGLVVQKTENGFIYVASTNCNFTR